MTRRKRREPLLPPSHNPPASAGDGAGRFMTIIEHFKTANEAHGRVEQLTPGTYALTLKAAAVAGPTLDDPKGRWHVEIETKLVPILRDPDGIPKEELDSAYQKVLEENAVLRRTNADLYKKLRQLRLIFDDVKMEIPIDVTVTEHKLSGNPDHLGQLSP